MFNQYYQLISFRLVYGLSGLSGFSCEVTEEIYRGATMSSLATRTLLLFFLYLLVAITTTHVNGMEMKVWTKSKMLTSRLQSSKVNSQTAPSAMMCSFRAQQTPSYTTFYFNNGDCVLSDAIIQAGMDETHLGDTTDVFTCGEFSP